MAFKLSNTSLKKLEGVNEQLVQVVKDAIELTKVDFGVTYGLRTLEEQKELYESGRSQTMKSKHLEGNAVDLMAWVDGGRWELNLYDEIADAMLKAAKELGVTIRWGAAWHKALNDWDGTAEDLMNEYIDIRRSAGRRPFIDAPHFEMM